MIAVGYQGAHLGGIGWSVRFAVLRKRTRSTVKIPGSIAGTACLLDGDRIKEEMDMHAR